MYYLPNHKVDLEFAEDVIKNADSFPGPRGSVGWSVVLQTKGTWAHTQVAGLLPGWGAYEKQPIGVSFTLMFLSVSVSLFLSLSFSPALPFSLKAMKRNVLG